ncbi:OmpA family protein [Variovorax sp. J22R133]|uniref:OmpA family protein n=1 Tax=Variovorax brevis TaxID=3053503 RepID=UPI002574A144|nr:OmpA family protein [Variovorax sp. J22R133]MDM0111521.1 OmpA family protein [Variovorax sp. J22R133]
MKRTMLAVAVGTLLVLQGCASTTPGAAIDKEAQSRAAANVQAPKASDFPALDNAKWKQGAFPNIENLRKMNTGMGKDQVRELLGWPHFSEGLWGVREWNYIFHFRSGKGAEYVTCQYMVRFSKDELSTGGWWKDPACAKWLDVPAAPVAVAAPAPKRFTLNTDGLFRFDGSSSSDLKAEGHAQIERLASDIRSKTVAGVLVTGHTDRLGSDNYNNALSLARANTVRELLVRKGIDAKLIRTAGMGERQPVKTDCVGNQQTPALVECLAPNRRVEVDVTGVQ